MKQAAPPRIYCDNQSTIDAYKAVETTKRGRYIDVNYHCVRLEFLKSKISLNYVNTKENIADLLTKLLPHEVFQRLVKKVFKLDA